MQQLIKYLRQEPTTDELLHNESFTVEERAKLAKKKDVVMYDSLTDLENGKPSGRWMWYYLASKPHKNRRSINISGYRYKIIWMPTV